MPATVPPARRPLGRPARLSPGLLVAVLATFLLVVIVFGSLEAGVVWGLADLLQLPAFALDGALGVAGAAAVLLGLKAAQRSWLAERRFDEAKARATPEKPHRTA